MITTTNMSLNLPVVGVDSGATGIEKIITALETVDQHDHTYGKGAKIPQAGINITDNLTVNGFNITDIGCVICDDQAAALTGADKKDCFYFVGGDFYVNNLEGTPIKITSGTGLNLSSVGTIGGDYGSPGIAASVTYSDLTKTFSFAQTSTIAAKVAVGDILVYETVASPNAATIKSSPSLVAAADIVLPPASGTLSTINLDETISGNKIISGTTNFTGVATFTAAPVGLGIIPIGSVIPVMSHLTGAYNCTATTAADSNGYVLCGGQTISDNTSPMQGQVIPNINNSVFLMGSSTAGQTGGANSLNLSHAHTISHYHGMSHNHNTTVEGININVNHNHTYSVTMPDHYHNLGDNGFACVWHGPNGGLDVTTRLKTGLSWTGNSSTNSGGSSATSSGGPWTITSGAALGGRSESITSAPTISGTTSTSNLSHTISHYHTMANISTAITQSDATTSTYALNSPQDIRPNYISAKYIMRIK